MAFFIIYNYLCGRKQYRYTNMKIKFAFTILSAAVLMIACGGKKEQETDLKHGHTNEEMRLKGDETVYGLACEGCNDSVIVLLPNDGSDPVRYDIIDAHRNHKVQGDIKIGDWIGVVLNKDDKKVADLVVNLDQLKGIWCYIVMPKMRDYDKLPERVQRRMERNMPDSVKATYMIPREYGFWLQRHWNCQSVGYIPEQTSLEDQSPVVYPKLGYFTSWHIWNGKLIVVSATPHYGKDNTITTTDEFNDTCDIDYLGADSLVLTDRWGTRSYYRKNDIRDVNVKARQIAEKLKKEALQKAKE